MAFAPGEPVRDQGLRTAEEDNAGVASAMHEHVAVGALERGAGDHGVPAALADPVDLVGDSLQPWPAVLVGEGPAGAHLGDIARGVKPVAVLISPVQPFGEPGRDRAFAGSGDPHHDQRARRFTGLVVHEGSPPSAARSASNTVSPMERARFAGRSSCPSRRVRIARFCEPATSNSISRQEPSAGKVSVTLGTKGSTCALGTPTTQRLVSSTAGSSGNSDAV